MNIKYIFYLFISLLLIGCSKAMCIKIAGSINSEVAFTIVENISDIDNEKPKENNLNLKNANFTVYDKTDETSKILWDIYGDASISKLIYGQLPKGFSQNSLPKKLEINSKYYFSFSGSERFSPKLYASGFFCVNNQGVVNNCQN